MNLDFTIEQKLIKDEAANFLKKECPFDKVKELEDSEAGYSPAIWKKMAKLGWLGLAIPEAYGGDSESFMDLILLSEEIGKSAMPSPFFSTIVQCGLIFLESGSKKQKKELLPKIVKGKMILALAQYEVDASYDIPDIQMKAEENGDHYTLNGTKMFVMDANIADKLIVVAGTGENQVSLFLVDAKSPGLRINKMPTIGMDNTCEVIFENVKTSNTNLIGALNNGKKILEKTGDKAIVVKAAEMLGGCKACIDMTADYVKQREQYGKPIGAFQAIQHYMANMLVEYQTCYNYLYKTASNINEGEDVGKDASALKACTNQAYLFISERAVQIYGGMGTTREGDIGLFFRRAKAFEFQCGDTEWHYEKVFQILETG